MNAFTTQPTDAVKIRPKEFIHLIEYEVTTMFDFCRSLRKYFVRIGGPKSFYFDLKDWKEAKQLSKYVDELY